MNPRLIIDLGKFAHNAATLCGRCREKGVGVAAVTKVFCADPRMVKRLIDIPVDYLADSRIENIERYPACDIPKILLRLPSPSEAGRVVRACDISLNSERHTLELLAAEAKKAGVRHGVLLMVDMGDLREGIYHDRGEEILETAEWIEATESLALSGLGVNLTCYGSVIPTADIMERFCAVAQKIEAALGRPLAILSGGNSSSLHLLESGGMPEKINQLRLGESVVCGVETAYQQPIDSLYTDVVTLEAEIVELKNKPSHPEGEIGRNAFGEKVQYTDIGRRERAIVAVGRQDIEHEAVSACDAGVQIVGASSDHLIVDVTDCERSWRVGDRMRFALSYASILRGFTSPFVEKAYIE